MIGKLMFGSIKVPVYLSSFAEFVEAIGEYKKGDLGFYDLDRPSIWIMECDNSQQMGLILCHEIAHMLHDFSAYPEKMNDEIMARLNERWLYLLLKDNAEELKRIFEMIEMRARELQSEKKEKTSGGHNVDEFYPEEEGD